VRVSQSQFIFIEISIIQMVKLRQQFPY